MSEAKWYPVMLARYKKHDWPCGDGNDMKTGATLEMIELVHYLNGAYRELIFSESDFKVKLLTNEQVKKMRSQ